MLSFKDDRCREEILKFDFAHFPIHYLMTKFLNFRKLLCTAIQLGDGLLVIVNRRKTTINEKIYIDKYKRQ